MRKKKKEKIEEGKRYEEKMLKDLKKKYGVDIRIVRILNK